jgi:hypothetical protein
MTNVFAQMEQENLPNPRISPWQLQCGQLANFPRDTVIAA